MQALPSFPTRRSSDLVRTPTRMLGDFTRRIKPTCLRVLGYYGTDTGLITSLSVYARTRAPNRLTKNIKTTRRTRRRSEEHTSELQSRGHIVCRTLHEK